MIQKAVVTLRKPSQAECLLWAILVLPFLFGLLIEGIGLPTATKYICDLAWLGLLLLMLLQRRIQKQALGILPAFAICYFLYTLLGFAVRLYSPLYYLWGARNHFRMYAVFFAVILFAKQDTCHGFLRFFDKLFWINAAVCLAQYFIFHKQQDYLGGIFGVTKGCNGYLNNYFVIISIMELLRYLQRKSGLGKCVCKCGAMLLISVLAELKFFYVEFAVIVVMAVLLTDFSWRKALVLAGMAVGVAAATGWLVVLFPEFGGIFSLRAMLESAMSDAGYTGQGDINRLNAIPVLSDRFLHTLPEQLFGLGLGSCDTSGFSFLNTPFYEKYAYLNYIWFSVSFVFLETGFIGLGFFFGFFVLVYLGARKLAKQQPQNKMYCQMAMLCAVCCGMIGIYNSTLRTEAGYMLYIMLALPFAKARNM